MKLLTLRDLGMEDSLALFFNTTIDHMSDVQRELDPFLEALEEYADEWMPDIVKGKRQRKYSREAVWKALEEERTEYSSGAGTFHSTYPFVSLALSYGMKTIPRDFEFSLHIQPLTFFTED